MGLVQLAANEWELPRSGAMRVPGRLFAAEEQLEASGAVLAQLANIAGLPGIVSPALALPGVTPGQGFPVGSVAAFDPEQSAVIVPAAAGYDSGCGVLLLEVRGVRPKKAREHRGELARALFEAVPSGAGRSGSMPLRADELEQVLRRGAAWAVERDLGTPEDLERLEERGTLPWAEPRHVSADARIRGAPQLGTLGAGGHFIEVQTVEEVFDEPAAQALGLELGGLTVAIHSGSRALGHQVSSDCRALVARHPGPAPLDPELCCAPFDSAEGQACFGALAAAANFALANRQIITQRVREVLTRAFGEVEVSVVGDQSHNLVRLERHTLDGARRELVVHRRGAARALGPGHPRVPEPYRAFGHPVVAVGGLGRPSFVLLGTSEAERRTFASLCHRAGRDIGPPRELAKLGISLQAANPAALANAHPGIEDEIEVVTRAGLARRVASLRPFAIVKG